MMRNLKVLGLALVAVFAMSAVAASMASADTLKSEPSQTVTLKGSQEENDVFGITAGNTSCKQVTYTATTPTPTSSVAATPAYPEKTTGGEQNCTSLGFPAKIELNGCSYKFAIGAATTGTLDVVCPVGKEITVVASSGGVTKCIIHVPAQTALGTITYTNVGAGTTREVTVSAKITTLKYSHTAGEGLGKCTAGTGTTGTYTGKAVITAAEDNATAGHVAIFVS
jgi:hypothetical protein